MAIYILSIYKYLDWSISSISIFFFFFYLILHLDRIWIQHGEQFFRWTINSSFHKWNQDTLNPILDPAPHNSSLTLANNVASSVWILSIWRLNKLCFSNRLFLVNKLSDYLLWARKKVVFLYAYIYIIKVLR